MSRPKPEKIETYWIFNRRILIFFFAFLAALCAAIAFFRTGEKDLAFPLLGSSLLLSLGFFVVPLYYTFTKKEITVTWLFRYKRTIPWNAIKSVIVFHWGEAYRDLPKYEILYHLSYKGCVITKQFDLPKNKKTKKMIEKYAKGKIV